MIKPIIPPQSNPIKIRVTNMSHDARSFMLTKLSESFAKNFDLFLKENKGKVDTNKLQEFLSVIYPGLKTKVSKTSKKLDGSMQVYSKTLHIKLNPLTFQNQDNLRLTFNHENMHLLYGTLFGFPVPRLEKDLSRLYMKKAGNIFQLFKCYKANVKHHKIYRGIVYCRENKNAAFSPELFSKRIDNAFQYYKIDNIHEKIYNLRAFLKRLESEQTAYNHSVYNTVDSFDRVIKECVKIDEIYEFNAKIKVLKSKLKNLILFDRSMNAVIYPQGRMPASLNKTM